MPKKAFITGITGMVGSHLAEYLLKKTNWKLYGFCRWNSKLNNLFHLNNYIKKGRLNLIYGDLLDENSLNSGLTNNFSHNSLSSYFNSVIRFS